MDPQFDTIIVPARDEGFRRVFLGESKWYPVRLSPESRQRLRYLAVYRSAPISAVTHVADVKAFSPLGDGRWAIELEGVREVEPVKFTTDEITKTLQTPRLARLERLLAVSSLNEILRG
jgi:hypothetical protein